MRTYALSTLCCIALLVGCSSDDPDNGTGGKGGSGGSGGSTGGRGGTGGTTGGSGGSTGGTTGGSGGSTGGSGGSTGGTGGGSGGSTGGTGGTGGSTGGTGGSSSDAKMSDAKADSGSDTSAANPPGGYAPCPKCRPLFDGKNLDQWNQAAAGAWIVKNGAMASTGKAADAWTKEDFGSYRIFFSVRQIMGNHQPGVLFFGNRNGDMPARGLQGIQVQPPNGYTWDYRPGKNNSGGNLFTKLPHPRLDVKQWSQCEVLVKDTGELRVACCQLTGTAPCKGVEQLRFKDPAAAGKKSPFGIQMHNGGLFDEYKDIYVEPDPTEDDLLSIK
jgi:Domain of Unknown Function (DUF1080)